jgi:hypothetical protein
MFEIKIISEKFIKSAGLESLAQSEIYQGSVTDDHSPVFWQVFFLPKLDVNSPTSFIAFCPFTKVISFTHF